MGGTDIHNNICAEYHVQVLCHENDTNQWTFIFTFSEIMYRDVSYNEYSTIHY